MHGINIMLPENKRTKKTSQRNEELSPRHFSSLSPSARSKELVLGDVPTAGSDLEGGIQAVGEGGKVVSIRNSRKTHQLCSADKHVVHGDVHYGAVSTSTVSRRSQGAHTKLDDEANAAHHEEANADSLADLDEFPAVGYEMVSMRPQLTMARARGMRRRTHASGCG